MIEKEHTAEVCLHIVELKKQSDLLIKSSKRFAKKFLRYFSASDYLAKK